MSWPEIRKPSSSDWRVWKKVLKTFLCGGENLDLGDRMVHWFEDKVREAIPDRKWYWYTSTNSLYGKVFEGWRKYMPVEQTH